MCCFDLPGQPPSNRRVNPKARTWLRKAYVKKFKRSRIHPLYPVRKLLPGKRQKREVLPSSPSQKASFAFLGQTRARID